MRKEKKFERPPLPESAKGTGTYIIADNLGVVLNELEQIPDILGNGSRCRRYGAWWGVHVVPNLDKAATLKGPVILPTPPAIFVDADTLDQLRARMYHEIDVMIDSVKQVQEDEAVANSKE